MHICSCTVSDGLKTLPENSIKIRSSRGILLNKFHRAAGIYHVCSVNVTHISLTKPHKGVQEAKTERQRRGNGVISNRDFLERFIHKLL